MRRLVILGDSHVFALQNGFMALGGEPPQGFDSVTFLKLFNGADNLGPFFEAHPDRIVFTGEGVTRNLARRLGQPALSTADRDTTVFGFSMGLMTTIMVRSGDWALHAPASAGASIAEKWRRRYLVSDAIVETIALDQQKHVLAFFTAAKAMGLRFMAISAPPLRADEHAIVRGRSANVIAAVDRLARSALTKAFAEMGVPVVLPLPETFVDTQDGRFMAAQFRELGPGDTNHANEAFGAVMMPEVIRQALALAGSP